VENGQKIALHTAGKQAAGVLQTRCQSRFIRTNYDHIHSTVRLVKPAAVEYPFILRSSLSNIRNRVIRLFDYIDETRVASLKVQQGMRLEIVFDTFFHVVTQHFSGHEDCIALLDCGLRVREKKYHKIIAVSDSSLPTAD
ncbi:hypothetical protein KIN20_006687, partial [Parelaphostrongylus tenuis]